MTDEGYDAKIARLRERIAKLKKNPANARAIADLEDELKLLEHDAKKTDGQKLMDAVSTLRGRVEVAAVKKDAAAQTRVSLERVKKLIDSGTYTLVKGPVKIGKTITLQGSDGKEVHVFVTE